MLTVLENCQNITRVWQGEVGGKVDAFSFFFFTD